MVREPASGNEEENFLLLCCFVLNRFSLCYLRLALNSVSEF